MLNQRALFVLQCSTYRDACFPKEQAICKSAWTMTPALPSKREEQRCAMVEGFVIYAMICRFGGCFFIQNFRKKLLDEMRATWKSPYIIYSAFCFVSLALFEFVFVIGSVTSFSDISRAFTQSLLLILYAVVTIMVTVNFFSVTFGSSKLLAFFRKSASFERVTFFKARRSPSSAERRWSLFRKVFLIIVLAVSCFNGLFFFVSNAGEKMPSKWRRVVQAHAAFCGILFFLYDSLPYVFLGHCCEVLSEYLQAQLEAFHECERLRKKESDFLASVQIEKIRLNHCLIRKLKEALNDVWQWSLVGFSATLIIVLCIVLYAIFSDGTNRGEVLVGASYALYAWCSFVEIAIVSQDMRNNVSAPDSFSCHENVHIERKYANTQNAN